MSKRGVIYARQSLDRTGVGEAVDRQTADCQRLADQRGWSIVDTITDNDMSASSGKPRPGYQRLLRMMRAGAVDVVVVWHVDRLTRRLVDLEEVISVCESTGVRLATVTGDLDLSTDAGRLVARILASVARGEVERKGARQRLANHQRAKSGQMGWVRRPFGYDRDANGRIVVVEDEAAGIKAAAEIVLNGGTVAAATRMLVDRGLPTTQGGAWSVTSLRRILLSPRNIGRVSYLGADMGAGDWPPILDAHTYDRLREVLRDVSRRKQQGTERKHLLSGLALCGRCGATMYATGLTNGKGKYTAYRCTKCTISRNIKHVDELVTAVMVARLSLPDAAHVLSSHEDVAALRAEAGELRQRRDDLAGLLADGLLSATAVRERSGKLTEQLRKLDDRISAALGASPAAQLVAADDVAAAWEAMPLHDRKRALSLLMTVTILPAGKGQPFHPDHVRIEWVTA